MNDSILESSKSDPPLASVQLSAYKPKEYDTQNASAIDCYYFGGFICILHWFRLSKKLPLM